MNQRWTAIGGLFALTAVMLGAFGAHGLAGHIPADRLDVFKTAAHYQMFHALALIVIGMRLEQRPGVRTLSAAAGLIAAGIAIFSGSLYLFSVTGTTAWAMVTPVGGLAFMAGWAVFAIGEIAGRETERQA
jgi:uncharacterized membrane protein YgdD (TMEM256/DUF423 family)